MNYLIFGLLLVVGLVVAKPPPKGLPKTNLEMLRERLEQFEEIDETNEDTQDLERSKRQITNEFANQIPIELAQLPLPFNSVQFVRNIDVSQAIPLQEFRSPQDNPVYDSYFAPHQDYGVPVFYTSTIPPPTEPHIEYGIPTTTTTRPYPGEVIGESSVGSSGGASSGVAVSSENELGIISVATDQGGEAVVSTTDETTTSAPVTPSYKKVIYIPNFKNIIPKINEKIARVRSLKAFLKSLLLSKSYPYFPIPSTPVPPTESTTPVLPYPAKL